MATQRSHCAALIIWVTNRGECPGSNIEVKICGICLMKTFKNVLILCAWIFIVLLLGYMFFVGGKL